MKVENLVTREEGKNDKVYWNNIGKMFTNDEGKRSIKLNMFPGLWIGVFEQTDRDKKEVAATDVEEDDVEEAPF